MQKLLYATNNPGKQAEVSKLLKHHGINVLSPKDLGISIDPDETGNSLEENATIKCRAFADAISNPSIIVMADDTGVEIDALGGEPGIHVRRWKGYRMEDEEIIQYCTERMKDVLDGQRGAQFRTVLAVSSGDNIQHFEGILEGEIVKEPIKLRMEGFPFESIFYIPEYGKMLGAIHQMTSVEKENLGFHSHRERAVANALPTIKQLVYN